MALGSRQDLLPRSLLRGVALEVGLVEARDGVADVRLVVDGEILGPFLVMFLFGLGYSGYRAPFATEIVVPADADFSRSPEDYAELAPGRLDVRNVGEDVAAAEQRLRDGEIDLLVVVPSNASAESVQDGRPRSASSGTRSIPCTTSSQRWPPRSWSAP